MTKSHNICYVDKNGICSFTKLQTSAFTFILAIGSIMKKLISVISIFLLSFTLFAKSAAKNINDYKVGDIVLEDGSTISYKKLNASQKSKAVAVIFYVEEPNSPLKGKLGGKVLGLGLNSAKKIWATENAPFRLMDLESLKNDVFSNGSEGILRLEHSHSVLNDSTKTMNLKDYPAFEYCKNYRADKKTYNKGWFLPSKLEIEQLKNCAPEVAMALYKAGANKTFLTEETEKFDSYAKRTSHGFRYLNPQKSIIASSIWTSTAEDRRDEVKWAITNYGESLFLSIYETLEGSRSCSSYRTPRNKENDVFPVYAFVENDSYICPNCKTSYTAEKYAAKCAKKKGCVSYEEITPKYKVGDFILKNGKVVSKENWNSKINSQIDCIVFYAGSKSTDVLGAKVLAVNVKALNTKNGIPFYDEEALGDKEVVFDDESLIGDVKWHKPYNLPYNEIKLKTFEKPDERYVIGDADGSDNWELICKKFPEETKGKARAKYFPAMDWIKTTLGEEYYIPSLMEASVLKQQLLQMPYFDDFNIDEIDLILSSTLTPSNFRFWSVGHWDSNNLTVSTAYQNGAFKTCNVGIKRLQ